MVWMTAVPAAVVAVALLFGPGLLVLRAGGRLDLGSFALAAPVSVAIVAGSAVVADLAGVPWSVLPVVVVTVAAAAVMALVSRDPGARIPSESRATWIAAGTGVALGAAVLVARLSRAIADPGHFSQSFDNINHLNTVHFILREGTGSSFAIGAVSDIRFYPGAWHDLVSLVVQLTGASIPVAANAFSIVVAALAWPIGCAALTRVLVGRPIAILAAGVLSAAFAAFPYLLIYWGVLYPNFLAYAILPGALAMVAGLTVFRPAGSPGRAGSARSTLPTVLVVVAVLGGVAIAHPNGLMSLAALSLPWVLVGSLTRARGAVSLLHRVGWTAAAVGSVLVVCAAWRLLRTSELHAWRQPIEPIAASFGSALLLAPVQLPITWALAALIAAGCVWAVLQHSRRLVVAPFVVAVFLYVTVAGGPALPFRDLVTNIWYNDSHRLAALLPVAAVPVAAAGAAALAAAVDRVVLRARRRLRWAVGVVGLIGFVVATQGPNVRQGAHLVATFYALDEQSSLVDPTEYELLERLDANTPADAIIVGNPATGASLAYALADRRVLEMHIFGTVDPDERYVTRNLARIESDPEVCSAVRSTGADYVLDFGARDVFGNYPHNPDYAGVENVREGEHLRLVDEVGHARLFEIVGCDAEQAE